MGKLDLNIFTDQEILEMPIKRLVSGRVRSFSRMILMSLKKELANRGIKFIPQIWCSTDWFSPDGEAGFAYPFYLTDERLKSIYLKYFYEVEGDNFHDLQKLSRHECAHAIDNAFGLRKLKNRQKIFGITSIPYPLTYVPQKNKNEFIDNLGESYGMSHPDEDWAETFAVWLSGKNPKFKSIQAKTKYKYLDFIMNEKLVNQKYNFKKVFRVENALGLELRFIDFINERKQELRYTLGNPPVFKLSKKCLYGQVKELGIPNEKAIIITRNLFNLSDFSSNKPGQPNKLLMKEIINKFDLCQVVM